MEKTFFSNINADLDLELSGIILSPESGIQKIRRVLADYSIEMPAFYDLDVEGNEIIYDISDDVHLYIIYTLEDNGRYEFYSEITDNDGLEEILSDEDEEDEE
jgi:hypothetical protein